MPETKVYRVSGIIRRPEGWDFPVCISDPCLFICLTYDTKKYYFQATIYCAVISLLFFFYTLRRKTAFSERHSLFFALVQKWRHFWKKNLTSLLMSHVSAVSAHGQDKISSGAKNRTIGKKNITLLWSRQVCKETAQHWERCSYQNI